MPELELGADDERIEWLKIQEDHEKREAARAKEAREEGDGFSQSGTGLSTAEEAAARAEREAADAAARVKNEEIKIYNARMAKEAADAAAESERLRAIWRAATLEKKRKETQDMYAMQQARADQIRIDKAREKKEAAARAKEEAERVAARAESDISHNAVRAAARDKAMRDMNDAKLEWEKNENKRLAAMEAENKKPKETFARSVRRMFGYGGRTRKRKHRSRSKKTKTIQRRRKSYARKSTNKRRRPHKRFTRRY